MKVIVTGPVLEVPLNPDCDSDDSSIEGAALAVSHEKVEDRDGIK